MIIRSNRALPKPALQTIALLGWPFVLYLAWIVGNDSFVRTRFAIGALSGAFAGVDLDPFNARYAANPWLTLMHTIPGMLYATLGPLQFVTPIRNRWRGFHRGSGKVFMTIAAFSAISALTMGFVMPVWGMTANRATTLVWSAFMLFALYKAYGHIRARRIDRHREWMIRAFTTGLAVAWFRFMLNEVLQPAGMGFTDAWNVVVTMSLPTALLAAEGWIRATRPKGAGRTVPVPATA